LALAGGGALAGAAVFLSEVEDLPLVPGLEEVPQAGVVFDAPGGRVVEAFAVGDLSESDVLGFYRRTLPQLGWQRQGTGDYVRAGERLRIGVSSEGDALTVRFRITPE